ncbi:MAG: DUF4982 domain-containing protein, partial [Sedimentisphaerales bacterium]|nr:DUF4982 domain-containing protein [Sedimentisphaerales bacterium]
SEWRLLNLPHDWSIEGPIDRDNPTGRGGAYMPCGIGWYRKEFTIPAEAQGRKIFIDFDGVMANSKVWLNGQLLGERPFGYIGFRYDMTDKLNYGGKNIIAVVTDTYDQPASRWYTGAGIYRHVRLVMTDKIHFDNWGIFITTPEVTEVTGKVKIENTLVNETDKVAEVVIKTAISLVVEPDKLVMELQSNGSIPAGGSELMTQEGFIKNPALWSIDNPNLYLATSMILIDGLIVDTQTNIFGVRSFEFKADSGFWLNGENIKIKGVCLHHDGGAVGAAVPKRVWQRRFEKLREIGCNAIRTSHNPMSPEFLDLCDEMGFVVMDEVLDTWRARKNNADYGYQHHFNKWWYADNRDTVLRDRNHPSIILYSAGNEIRDDLSSPAGFATFKGIYDLFKKYDPTRPVTQGVFRPNQSKVYDSGYAELMDVVGQNYREEELVAAYKARPSRKVIGTENGHGRDAWLVLRDNPFMAGQFLWTGIDYLGEADWPDISWSNACIDRIGNIRPMGYQRMSWWSDKPMVSIARKEVASGGAGSSIKGGETVSHWTPRDYDTYDQATVEVYSNCETVELFINDKSLGEKAMPQDASPVSWDLAYTQGVLKAVGKNGGTPAAQYESRSAEYPVAINMVTDRKQIAHDFDDVSHVEISFVDANGVECPWAEKPLKFEVTGPGRIVAVDNGDPTYHDSFQGNKCRTYQGRCLVIIAATADEGKIILKASTRGMDSASVKIEVAN